jgi:hypothetical protein
VSKRASSLPLRAVAERFAIRVATAALLLIALVISVWLDPPTVIRAGRDVVRLPDVALGQQALYRLEVGLVAFYGGLFILVPLFFGVVRGRLPTEISARGAKFGEDVDESIKEAQALVDDLDRRIEYAESRLARDRLNIDQLAVATGTRLED